MARLLIRRLALALAFAALCALPVRAEGPSLRAEVDATRIGVEDQVQLTLTLSGGGGGDLPLPPLVNLRAVAGPFTSSQMSWVNGVTSQTRSATWVLQPRSVGKASVGVVTVDVDGGKRSTAPIEIEVVAGSLGPPPQAQRRGRPDPFGDPFGGTTPGRARRGAEPRVRVRALADRTRLHVGEPLVVEFVIDTQASVSDLQLVEAPQFPGFWSEDLDKREGPPNGEPVTDEGESFRRFPLLRKLLFPTRAGSLTVPAATFRIGFPRESLFDPPRPPAERSSEPLTVQVAPLPVGAAAVGVFQAEATVDRDRVALGEAVTVRFKVSGTGNLKWVEAAPALELPGAKVYPPQSRSEFAATEKGLTGSRSWEWVVVPQTAGPLEIPALSLAYFDPARGALAQAESKPLRIETAAAVAGAPVPVAPRGADQAPGLRSELDLPGTSPLEAAGAAGLALGLAALAHALLAWRPGRGPARERDRDALAQLQRAARGGVSREELSALVERALHERFGEMGPGADSALAREARALLADVQFLRYAPQLGDYSDKLRELAARAADLLPQGRVKRALVVAAALAAGALCAQDGGDPAARFRAANAHALAGDQPRAIAAYEQLAAEGHESAALYWNWAQAAAARGAQGEALWALLRGREVEPRDRALAREIERARERLGLEAAEIAPDPLAELARAARRFRLGVVVALLALISVALHAGARVRHASLRPAAVAFGLAAFAALPALLGTAAKPLAVVAAREAVLFDQASPGARPLGRLREGEVVPVLERAGDYLRIEDASGARGWSRAADVRRLQGRQVPLPPPRP